MLNTIILIGNLGRDPELQRSQDGKDIAKFSLATSSMPAADTDEWYENTAWHKIIVFREMTARWAKHTLKKGNLVCVEGKLTYKLIKNEQDRSIWLPYIVISNNYGNIELLLPKKSGGQSSADSPLSDNESNASEPGQDSLEDIPVPLPQSHQHKDPSIQQHKGETL